MNVHAPAPRQPVVSRLLRMVDTFTNLVSGLGTSKDKTTHTQYSLTLLNKATLDAMYRGDWIARKVVNAPAQDATRAWRAWQAEDEDIEAIEEAEKALRIQKKVFTAQAWARLYGGAALILGVGQGNSKDELVIDSVGKDDLKFVHVVNRYELSADQLVSDVLSPYFREPTLYRRTLPDGKMVEIHPSRVVRFIGAELPDPNLMPDGWGDSILQSVEDAIRAAGITQGSIAHLVQEARLKIMRIPELTERITTDEYADRLTTRLALSAEMASVHHTLLMDKEEEWDQMQVSFASLPEILQMYLLIAAGAADIPATRLLGQSPAGMNATGESDTRNYYDRISSDQTNELSPNLTRLDEVLIRSATGARDESIYHEWNPLWQMNDAEKADLSNKKATTFKVDLDSGLFSNEVMRKARESQLIEDGTYPALELAIEEEGEEADIPADEDRELSLAEREKAVNEPSGSDVDLFGDSFDPNQPRDPKGTPTGGQWTSGEKAAVEAYLDYQDFEDINDQLRRRGEVDDEDYAEHVKNLEGLINKHELPADTLFYRGVSEAEDSFGHNPGRDFIKRLDDMEPGDTFVDRGFMSVSKNKGSAGEYGPEGTGLKGAMLVIRAKRGDKAMPLKESYWDETLFQRGTRLRLVEKRTKDNTYVFETVAASRGVEQARRKPRRGSRRSQDSSFGGLLADAMRRESYFTKVGPNRYKRKGGKGKIYTFEQVKLWYAKHARGEAWDSALEDAQPRTLYMRRDVLNADAIIAWAKGQGFKETIPASEMHVTIVYSKQAFDWMQVREDWNTEDEQGRMVIKPGGVRLVEQLGDEGAIVLMFTSSALSYRHESIVRAGASHDYSDYQPHVTFAYEGIEESSYSALRAVEPYRGEIVLGPEVWEEIRRPFDPSSLLDEYNPNQPRHPAGTEMGGQWAPAGGGASVPDNELEAKYSAQGKNVSVLRKQARELRKMLKTEASAEKRKKIKELLVQTMQRQHLLYTQKGNLAMAAKIEYKMSKFGVKPAVAPAVKPPVLTPTPPTKVADPPVQFPSEPSISAAEKQQFTPEEVEAFAILKEVAGGESSAKMYMSLAKSKLKQYPELDKVLTIKEASILSSYTGHVYGPINASLRQGLMTEKQWEHVKALNSALDKLPSYTGTVYRKANLPPEIKALYKPGMIIEERGFTSTSQVKGVWSGSTRYEIRSRTGKSVAKLSNHYSEQEVLFRSGSRFKVLKTSGDTIELEEV